MGEPRAERSAAGRRVRLVGVGMGPQHVTPEAAAALRSVDYVIAADKGADDPLLEVRREICRRHGDLPVVAVADPDRDRGPADSEGYAAAVRAWHDARAAAYEAVLAERPGDAAFLVWGDPSLYDSTLRVVEQVRARGRVGFEVEVVPGVSAPQLLAARHRVVLHEVGQPVHVTTARRLPEAVAAGQRNVVVMLGGATELSALRQRVADWSVWWAANLGTDSERLAAGIVDEVLDELLTARDAARAEAGWVMDTYLLRAPAGAPSTSRLAGRADAQAREA